MQIAHRTLALGFLPFCFLLFCQCERVRPGDPIDIPEAGFLNALVEQGVDSNGDGQISVEEAEAVTHLDVSWNGTGIMVRGLKGIEWFVNLEYLNCNYQDVRILELNNNPLLRELYCSFTGLKHLDISSCTDLEILDCSGNEDYLDCPDCGLKSLDVSRNYKLRELQCYSCLLSSLDLTNNKSLKLLEFGNAGITSIDLTRNEGLEVLKIYNSDITTLDLGHNGTLRIIEMVNNSLISDLDVSANPELEILECSEAMLSGLDLSQNPGLISLSCYQNQIRSLDLSNNTSLEVLIIEDNLLDSIDVSLQGLMWVLACGGNQLSRLDLSNNSALEYLRINYMPSLYEVCVWASPFPTESLSLDTLGSPNIYFTTNCSQ